MGVVGRFVLWGFGCSFSCDSCWKQGWDAVTGWGSMNIDVIIQLAIGA